MTDVEALIASYSRLGLFKHISTVCNEVITKKGSDPTIALWSALISSKEGAWRLWRREEAGLDLCGCAGNVAAAIRQAEAVKGKKQAALAALVCLTAFHERAGMVDRGALDRARSELREMERSASPQQMALAATFAIQLGDWDRALALADGATTAAPEDEGALTSRGWAELYSGGAAAAEAALSFFDQAVTVAERAKGAGSGAVDARMGRAYAFQALGRGSDALDTINDVTAVNKWMTPALAERGRLMMRRADWLGVEEAANALLEADPTDIEGLRLQIVKLLANDGNTAAAAVSVRQLQVGLEKHEPGNSRLLLECSRPIARLAGENRGVLEGILKMLRKARSADPSNSALAAECGFLEAQLGDVKGANESYTEAAKLDDSSVEAVAGLIWCQLAMGRWDDAEAQLEMFAVVQETVGRTATFALLDAIVAWRKKADAIAHVKFLSEARQLHTAAWHAASTNPMVDSHTAMAVADPVLIMRIAREFLIHARGSDSLDERDEEAAAATASSGSAASSARVTTMLTEAIGTEVRRAASVGLEMLQQLAGLAPGLAEARLLLARAQLRAGNVEEASRALVSVLSADASNASAHLLMAQVALTQGGRHIATAKSSLEHALAHDLRAHSSPVYQLVAARVAMSDGKPADAIRAATLALKTPGVRDAPATGTKPRGVSEGALATVSAAPLGDITDADRVKLFVILAEAHTAREDLKEATEVIDEATSLFTGTSEEVEVLVAHAKLVVAKGSAEAAVRMLGNVPFDSPNFHKAQQVKADILLRHRRDLRGYIQCFEDVVEHKPSTASRVALSEAYMRISLPEQAISTLEKALALSPRDGALIRRMGRALVRMHDYDRAARHYHAALDRLAGGSKGEDTAVSFDSGLVASLRSDLIELYVKQRRFADATGLIEAGLSGTSGSDAISLRATRESLRAMAKVQQGINDSSGAVATLEQALKVQQRVITRLRQTAPELLGAERESAADLCHDVAVAHMSCRPPNEDQAKRFLAEALKAREAHVPSLHTLAKLLIRRGAVTEAQTIVTSLKRAAPDLVAAKVLACQLLLVSNEVDSAVYRFGELFEAHPHEFEALASAVRWLNLAGRLEDAKKLVGTCERAGGTRAAREPGLKFCQGLIFKHSNKTTEAIASFNEARHAARWSVRAVEEMVREYVAPNDEAVWRNGMSGLEEGDSDDEAAPSSRAKPKKGSAPTRVAVESSSATSPLEASNTAIALLGSIPPKHRTPEHEVLRAYALMIRNEPASVEEAQKRLVTLLSQDENFIPAIPAIATLHLRQGEKTKARNHLRRLAKLPFDGERTEDFVRGYLMLADIFMSSAKHDHAIKTCQEALKLDQSCAMAWEILGDVAERDAAFADAAEHFAKAWKYDHEATARVGYKLAFNYLKARRFTKAIDICQQVLKQFPDYPAIKTDIVDVARASLRG
jgi:tetratricopeptide repeat protein 21B